jgi:hypothetical protein
MDPGWKSMIILKIPIDPIRLNDIFMEIIDEELMFREIDEIISEVYYSGRYFEFKVENTYPLSRIVLLCRAIQYF